MTDPELLQLTASEPLSLDEEMQMQRTCNATLIFFNLGQHYLFIIPREMAH